jgi:malonyl-CoA/methylmalonyl-CoA synthetase
VRERPELGNLTRVLLDGAGSRRGDLAFAALAGTAEARLPGVPPSTPALMLFTSGTTGPAKGAVFSADALKAGIGSLMNLWGMSERDSLVLALPLFHVHGLCVGLLGSFFSGASIQLLPGFHVQEIPEGIRGGGTVFMGVPTMYAFLLEHLETHAEDAQAMRKARLFTAGSAPLSPDHFHRFEALTDHRILERYGMTETLITLSNPLDGERRPRSVGFAVPGYETRVVDESGADVAPEATGELWVRGDGMMSGYHRNEEATRRSYTEGWFRTGDLATRDAEGFHRILGRTSADLIKSGGFRIAAREIEEVLALHPEIKEIAVLGLPDPTWGEHIVAAAVPRSRDRDPLELLDELSSLCERNLASYKKPRALALFDELPRNALGKILKHRIRESIVSGQTRLVSREG